MIFEFPNQVLATFTAKKENSEWKLSLDDKKVWADFTAPWYQTKRFRFSETVSEKVIFGLENAVAGFHQTILSLLQIRQKISEPMYVINSKVMAQKLGKFWDPLRLQGGAREGFLLFVGPVHRKLRSVVVHELIHTYTTYPGEFWAGPGVFANALFAEGFATWVQIPYAWNDEVPKKATARVLCRDIAAVRAKLPAILDLVDISEFRKFDNSSEGKAGYIAGAAIFDALWTQSTLAEFKVFWNQMGRLGADTQAIQNLIVAQLPRAAILEGMAVYLNRLESEARKQVQMDCAATEEFFVEVGQAQKPDLRMGERGF